MQESGFASMKAPPAGARSPSAGIAGPARRPRGGEGAPVGLALTFPLAPIGARPAVIGLRLAERRRSIRYGPMLLPLVEAWLFLMTVKASTMNVPTV